MKSILNSELDPADLGFELLAKAVLDPNFTIACLQKHFCDQFKFSTADARFDNVTPAQYQTAMQHAVEALENDVWVALQRAHDSVTQALGLPSQAEYVDPTDSDEPV